MKVRRALFSGVIGSVLVLILVWMGGRLGDADADLAALTAAVLFRNAAGAAWVGGFVAQLIVGAIAGVVYCGIFELVTERAGAWIGLAVAIPHAIIAGLAVGFLPAHRMLDAGVAPPGAFYEFRGAWCIAAFVLAHLAFGCSIGAMYGQTTHTYARVRRHWAEASRV